MRGAPGRLQVYYGLKGDIEPPGGCEAAQRDWHRHPTLFAVPPARSAGLALQPCLSLAGSQQPLGSRLSQSSLLRVAVLRAPVLRAAVACLPRAAEFQGKVGATLHLYTSDDPFTSFTVRPAGAVQGSCSQLR
jgi:hypothetical protein